MPSFPGRTFKAPIARISHGVDTKTRTMPVELDVSDPHMELVPGTFCNVEWPLRRNYPTLFVPVSAVASDLQRTFVIRVRENKTEWIDVKTGVRTGDFDRSLWGFARRRRCSNPRNRPTSHWHRCLVPACKLQIVKAGGSRRESKWMHYRLATPKDQGAARLCTRRSST